MYLVTGGAGFIGLNLVTALQARKAQGVAVCDWLEDPARRAAIAAHQPEFLIEPAELRDFLQEHRRDIEAVFHLGAISSTTETDWNLLQYANIDTTIMLWAWCSHMGVPFIYASSAATYGDGKQGFDDVDDLASLQRLKPLNLYAKSKWEADIALRVALQLGTAPPQWAGLKFFNVYGPHERHKGEQRSTICKFYDEIVSQGRARLFKSHNPDYVDGGQLRDFIAVEDCVDVMLWLYDTQTVSGLFNVGTGKARSFLDVAHAIFAAMDRTPAIEFIDMPLSLRDKYQYYTQAEMGRLRAAGYRRDFTTLEDGVRRYVQDYLMKDIA